MSNYSRIEINGIELAYAETGRGEDTVFLFHGVTAHHRVWAPVQAALAERYRVVAVDQRGHGHSGRQPGRYGAEEYSEDIRGLVERLGGERRNVLVGHSLGARNSIAAAARFPSLVSGIVAIDFTPFIETEVFDALEARVGAGGRRFASLAEVEEYLSQRYVNIPADAIRRRASYGYRRAEAGFEPLADTEAMLQTVRGLRADLGGYFGGITVPALVVRGAESVLVTERAFDRSRALRPDLEYAIVEGADHYVPEERPGDVADLVVDFIERNLTEGIRNKE